MKIIIASEIIVTKIKRPVTVIAKRILVQTSADVTVIVKNVPPDQVVLKSPQAALPH